MAWVLGMSAHVDLLLLAMIVPTIIQAMIGGGAGEILVIKRDRSVQREGSFEAIFIFSCLIPVIILGAAFFFSLDLLIPFFDIGSNDTGLFSSLSLIFIVNMIPGTFVSVLRPQLYSKGLLRILCVIDYCFAAGGDCLHNSYGKKTGNIFLCMELPVRKPPECYMVLIQIRSLCSGHFQAFRLET